MLSKWDYSNKKPLTCIVCIFINCLMEMHLLTGRSRLAERRRQHRHIRGHGSTVDGAAAGHTHRPSHAERIHLTPLHGQLRAREQPRVRRRHWLQRSFGETRHGEQEPDLLPDATT